MLNSVGIETNYVNKELTGVSMVRYRKIVKLLIEDFQLNHNFNFNHDMNHLHRGISGLDVSLGFIWEKSKTKQCLLDYLLAVENTSQSEIIAPQYNDLRIKDSIMRQEWLCDQYKSDYFTSEIVHRVKKVKYFCLQVFVLVLVLVLVLV